MFLVWSNLLFSLWCCFCAPFGGFSCELVPSCFMLWVPRRWAQWSHFCLLCLFWLSISVISLVVLVWYEDECAASVRQTCTEHEASVRQACGYIAAAIFSFFFVFEWAWCGELAASVQQPFLCFFIFGWSCCRKHVATIFSVLSLSAHFCFCSGFILVPDTRARFLGGTRDQLLNAFSFLGTLSSHKALEVHMRRFPGQYTWTFLASFAIFVLFVPLLFSLCLASWHPSPLPTRNFRLGLWKPFWLFMVTTWTNFWRTLLYWPPGYCQKTCEILTL